MKKTEDVTIVAGENAKITADAEGLAIRLDGWFRNVAETAKVLRLERILVDLAPDAHTADEFVRIRAETPTARVVADFRRD